MTVISLAAGPISARISLFGGAILRLDMGRQPLLRPAEDGAAPLDSACYPLVPFGNRVRGNRFDFDGHAYRLRPNTGWDPHYLHGEGWRSPWEVVKHSAQSLTLQHDHDGSACPYVYRCQQEIALDPQGARLSLSVTNTGERPMPFGLGWHPYFPLTPATTLQTETGRMWTEEPGWLPGHPIDLPATLDFRRARALPDHWVNNGFEDWSGRARIHWPERDLALTLTASPIFRTMFLFLSDQSFDPGYRRDFFALEPMSHLANGHNLADLGGLAVLRPGETLSGHLRLTPETAKA